MSMLNKTSLAGDVQKLQSAPGLSEIHHFLSQAMEHRGSQVVVGWSAADKIVEFQLAIHCPAGSGDTEWRLYKGTDKDLHLLWSNRTCDVLLVHNLIVSSSGVVQQEGETNDLIGQGDLSLVKITSLLQTMMIGQCTGCLIINREDAKARLFFKEGRPTYADLGQTTGDECILELITWRHGRYEFAPGQQAERINVKEELEKLILRGLKLKEKTSYLKNAGLWPESIIMHKHQNISKAEFDARTSEGAPVPQQLLRSIYTSIDNETSLDQITSTLNTPQSVWVPAICHLLDRDLITFTNDFTAAGTTEKLIPKTIDPAAIHGVMMSLRRTETGMFTYPAFLYFLEQEYFRGYRAGSPLSVMIMEMRVAKGPPDFKREPLPIPAAAEIFRRISQLKRHIDLVAHYETDDYAMILPNTRTSGANVFAQRVVNAVFSSPLPGGIHASKLSLAFGIACIPEDCTDLSYVLAAAEAAKAQAILLAAPVIAYRDIRAANE